MSFCRNGRKGALDLRKMSLNCSIMFYGDQLYLKTVIVNASRHPSPPSSRGRGERSYLVRDTVDSRDAVEIQCRG